MSTIVWGPKIYAVGASSPKDAIETAWQYEISTEGARTIHDYPVAFHKNEMLSHHRARYPVIYRTQIALKSLRPLMYDNKAEVWE